MCYGAALIMAAHLDILVAAESAKIGLLETRFGATGVNVLTYHVGPQWAKFLALSGEVVTARQAAQIGLILAAIPDDQFVAKVNDLARRIASIPPRGVEMNRQVVNSALDHMGWGAQDDLAIALNSIATAESRAGTRRQRQTFLRAARGGMGCLQDRARRAIPATLAGELSSLYRTQSCQPLCRFKGTRTQSKAFGRLYRRGAGFSRRRGSK